MCKFLYLVMAVRPSYRGHIQAECRRHHLTIPVAVKCSGTRSTYGSLLRVINSLGPHFLVITCPEIQKPDDLEIKISGSTFSGKAAVNSTARFTCPAGYKAQHSSAKCLSDGTWNRQSPNCIGTMACV